MKLLINSGSHANTDVESRVNEINEQVPNAEVLFIELASESISRKNKIDLFIYNPVLFISKLFLIDIARPLIDLFTGGGSDSDVIDEVDNGSVERIPVDIPHYKLMYENRQGWSIISYGILFLTIGAWIEFSGFTLIHCVLAVLTIGVLMTFTYVLATHTFRNQYMSQKIIEHSKTFEEGCFITGGKHHEGVAEELRSSDSVTLINSPSDS